MKFLSGLINAIIYPHRPNCKLVIKLKNHIEGLQYDKIYSFSFKKIDPNTVEIINSKSEIEIKKSTNLFNYLTGRRSKFDARFSTYCKKDGFPIFVVDYRQK